MYRKTDQPIEVRYPTRRSILCKSLKYCECRFATLREFVTFDLVMNFTGRAINYIAFGYRYTQIIYPCCGNCRCILLHCISIIHLTSFLPLNFDMTQERFRIPSLILLLYLSQSYLRIFNYLLARVIHFLLVCKICDSSGVAKAMILL